MSPMGAYHHLHLLLENFLPRFVSLYKVWRDGFLSQEYLLWWILIVDSYLRWKCLNSKYGWLCPDIHGKANTNMSGLDVSLRFLALSSSTSMKRHEGKVCPPAINICAKCIAKPFMAKSLAGPPKPINWCWFIVSWLVEIFLIFFHVYNTLVV